MNMIDKFNEIKMKSVTDIQSVLMEIVNENLKVTPIVQAEVYMLVHLRDIIKSGSSFFLDMKMFSSHTVYGDK